MNGLRIPRCGPGRAWLGRAVLAAGVAAAVACTSTAARADEESGVAVGLRIGGGIPFGNAYAGEGFSNFERASFPIWFDAGYRINRKIYIGAFYQYAVTFPASNNCPLGPTAQAQDPGLITGGQTTCDGRDQRMGLDLHVHLRPTEFADPWIGLGLGYEISTQNYSTGAAAEISAFTMTGPQADLQLGVDLRFLKQVPVGPFIDLAVADFLSASYFDQNGVGQGPVTFGNNVHGWLTLGLRTQFNL
ncbi:MAG: hypothetical protein ACLQVI_42745 [Polyangiaceae bacterium]|jgi:hypothetical protein